MLAQPLTASVLVHHSRDIHLTWVEVPAYDTGEYEGVQYERLGFKENPR